MYVITVTHTPQRGEETDPLFAHTTQAQATIPEAVGKEIARISVEQLDVHGLLAMIWQKPKKARKQRADAGKPRAVK